MFSWPDWSPSSCKQAAVCYGLAAKQGHPLAQYKLGSYHLEGRGNVKKCQKTAITLITQAAHGGVTQVDRQLHLCSIKGKFGVILIKITQVEQ